MHELNRRKFEAMTGELTPRQREVLSYVAQGVKNADIATAMNINIKTVEAHRSTALRMLRMDSMLQFMAEVVKG